MNSVGWKSPSGCPSWKSSPRPQKRRRRITHLPSLFWSRKRPDWKSSTPERKSLPRIFGVWMWRPKPSAAESPSWRDSWRKSAAKRRFLPPGGRETRPISGGCKTSCPIRKTAAVIWNRRSRRGPCGSVRSIRRPRPRRPLRRRKPVP